MKLKELEKLSGDIGEKENKPFRELLTNAISIPGVFTYLDKKNKTITNVTLKGIGVSFVSFYDNGDIDKLTIWGRGERAPTCTIANIETIERFINEYTDYKKNISLGNIID